MIRYPNGKIGSFKSKYFSKQNHANRGMSFEASINKTNQYYLLQNTALIYKKPTPIKVSKVENSNNIYKSQHKITEAYYEQKSTTDYNGVFLGKYIDFEVKQTTSSTFNIKTNLQAHQFEHLSKVKKHGGIAFILIYFQKFDKIYLLPIENLQTFLSGTNLKSQIKFEDMKKYAYQVEQKYQPQIDYLQIVKNIIESKENNESNKSETKK